MTASLFERPLNHPRQAVLDPAMISSWHAQVYFVAVSREAAWALRETIAISWPAASNPAVFASGPSAPIRCGAINRPACRSAFPHLIGWLTLNRGALDGFIHPNTGDRTERPPEFAAVAGALARAEPAGLGGGVDTGCGERLCASLPPVAVLPERLPPRRTRAGFDPCQPASTGIAGDERPLTLSCPAAAALPPPRCPRRPGRHGGRSGSAVPTRAAHPGTSPSRARRRRDAAAGT